MVHRSTRSWAPTLEGGGFWRERKGRGEEGGKAGRQVQKPKSGRDETRKTKEMSWERKSCSVARLETREDLASI